MQNNICAITPDKIGDEIISRIGDERCVFVFPTDIAATGWADWVVMHPEISGTTAVASERFVAWDNFKSSRMSATEKNKSSIPSLLRKLFVRELIAENAVAAAKGSPIFQQLICPEFAQNAFAFTDWIAGVLPSLKRWHEKYTKLQSNLPSANSSANASLRNQFQSASFLKENSVVRASELEDADYMMLYEKYSAYLEAHSLFEPSWLEPDFSAQNMKCVLFFPELLEDFEDYREAFESNDSVTIFCLPQENSFDIDESARPRVSFFSNARTELRAVVLQIKQLVKNGADWNQIAVSVPDIDTLRPYIEREFSLYGIPCMMRSGISLTQNSAGRIFSEMKDCVDSDFSYDSVRSLLLDDCVPWKERDVNESLVRLGNEYACICSYYERGEKGTKKIDVWEKALAATNTGNTSEREFTFYKNLRKEISKICEAKTFGEVRAAWFVFRERFLDAEKFSDFANLILGRCMSELSALIDIERKFIAPEHGVVASPFDFFVNEIGQKTYQPQETTGGVSVFPYRLSATAPFEYQFVVDSSQRAITVNYGSMRFLNKQKRLQLGISDEDRASDAFVRIYAGKGKCFFSGAAETFSGFAIPYSYLKKYSDEELNVLLSSLSEFDLVSQEKIWLSKNDEDFLPNSVMRFQKKGFDAWKKNYVADEEKYAVASPVENALRKTLCANRSYFDDDAAKVHLTQKDLNNFFVCPRKWIFACVLRFSEDSLDAELMHRYDTGNILHGMLEQFMKRYCASKKPLPIFADGFADEGEIRKLLSECATSVFTSSKDDFSKRPLVMAILDSQKNNFVEQLMQFLQKFCDAKNFGGWYVVGSEEKFVGVASESDSAASESPSASGEAFASGGTLSELAASSESRSSRSSAGWTFAGKLDCVLASTNGEVAIVDYKSGTTPTAAENIVDADGNIADFQMPVYVTLWSASEKNKTGKLPSAAVFWSIRGAKETAVMKENVSSRSKAVSPDDYKITLDAVHKKAKDFFERVGQLRLEPTSAEVKPYRDCIGCDFKSYCRTTYASL